MKSWIIDHARGFYWGVVLFFAFLAVGLYVAEVVSAPAGLALYLACSLGAAFLLNFSAFRKLRATIKQLDDACDPVPLLELSRSVLRQNPKSVTFGLNLGLTLILLNKKDESRTVLEPLEENRRLWKKPALTQLYCICRADVAPVEAAGDWLDRMERESAGAPNIKQVLEEQRATLALRRGETEGLEPIFLDRLERAQNLRIMVAWHFELGKLCLLQGRKGEAAEHLNYVADQGNKLHIRTEAEELLGKL
ncbi:putative PE_PGRS family protein [uncultured Eubacteriales bacterium]|uniref:Putative PE_PGRS family protein n=1 Tax=uncultured Eubacteriales bacterium TaxID=172733 RepID=A0A212KLT6_9FIRM|nr:putative PE_PGRS family protein [uncultured Eubacteriales bacterium]